MANSINGNTSKEQCMGESKDPASPWPRNEHHSGDELQNRLTDPQRSSHQLAHESTPVSHGDSFKPIAICGMACRLPGKIHNTQDLWKFLMSKSDARSVVPPTRYNISGYYSSKKKPGTAVSKYGYFLDEDTDLSALDTSFFSVARGEAERMDPQQRLLLEIARECLDDSGEVGWRGKDVGVYVGNFGNDWYDVTQHESQRYGQYQVSTTHDFALSNRLSYEMDLHGPSMTIRTACSSSLICLNEAFNAIAKGDCSSAIVGGTNIIMAPDLTTDMSEQGTLSPDGSCKTFSSGANGYARGEGVVAIYVKSLEAAIQDGNPIRAIVAGIATNSDGKTAGFSVPSAAAQESLIRHTYKLAGIDEHDICKTGFIECHGTGTPVGDPIEVEAITRVFGNSDGTHIGSIKPNLGHGEGASGLTAVLKAVLALENRIIPPNIKSTPLNERLRCDINQLIIPLEATPWPVECVERVSVNSFGVGGANAHVIIDSAASCGLHRPNQARTERSDSPHLLVYSANTSQSLKQMIAKYHKYLGKIPDDRSLTDIAYTLANRREHLPFRSFAVSTEDNPGVSSVQTESRSKESPSVIMVFTGQGSQWPQMGYDLFQTYPVFLQTIECLDRYLQELGELAPKWKIEEELHKSARLSRVNEAEFSQPLCTGLQIALIDTLAALGILPAGVVGHSSGEIAAAYAAQAITARDAILIAYFRGLVSRKQDKPGAMVAVGMSWEELENYIVPGVVRACDNSPNSVTLSGDAEPLLTLMDTLKKNIPGVVATKLHVDMAYHSHHMREVGDEYYHMLISSQISEGSPLIPFFSSLTGKLLPMNSTDAGDKHFGPHYWQMNLESPVLFNSAVSSIIREFKNPVFVEIGPHAALAGPLRQIMTRKSCSAPHISTLMRRKKGLEEMLKAVGRLWSLQVNVDFTKLMPFGTCVPDLPSYPWNHRRSHWFEPRVSRERRMREHPHHDLLGIRVPETSGIEPVWRNLLHIDNTPWLRDHKVRKDIVFPLAGYIAMAAEGARQLSPIQEGVELRNIIVTTALVLREEDPTELITNFRRHRLTNAQESTWWEFVVSSHNGHAWTKHCFGQIRASSNTIVGQDRIPEDKMMPHKVHIRQWYERARRGGSGYGYHFTTLEELRTSASGEVGLAKANVRNNWHGDEVNYHIHPVLVDTYLQLLCSAAHHGMREGYRQLIPASVGYIAFSTCTADSLTFIASCKRSDNRDGFVGSGVCFNNTATSLSISDVSVFPLAENIDMEVEHGPPITARSEWVPHIEFQNFSGLVMPSEDISEDFQLLETLAEVSMVLSQRLLSETSVESPNPHLNNYKSWLDRTVIHRYNNVDMEDLACRMEIYVGKLANTAVAPMATAIIQIQENITDIISGKKSGLEFLSSGFKLDAIQTFLKDYHAFNFFQYLGHAYPNLRVLEIGAGLGTATTSIVKALTRHDGQALFSRYVYTDSLPGLVVAAKEKFKGQPNMEFATLDINIDPASQEFKDEKFDLIIASNVLHSKLRLGSTLTHLRGLLSSRGRLVLQQPHTGMKWTKYILGIAPDWWSNGEDGIFDEHYVPTDDIRQGIVNAGFADPQEKLSEPTETGHGGTVLCLKPQLVERSCKVSIVSRDASDSDTSVGISQELKKRGLELFHCTLHDNLPPDHDAIILLDSEHSFLEQMNSESFEDLKRFLSTINNSSGVFWITKPAQTECSDPHNGLTVGFARVIRSELALDFATCETDDLSFDGLQILIDVFCKFRQRDNGTTPGPEMEYSINAGEVRVHRFFPFLLQDELRVSEPSDEVVLTTHLPGRLDSLHWTESLMLEPNGQEVEIVVYASGLNFRDVLIAMGIIDASSDESAFGYEAAGVVRRVGPDVKHLSIGDRVMAMAIGTFSTSMTTDEMLCEKIPDDMSFADGASMPIVFATAIYSLIDVARLEKGQSVLIHSGCGGVGLAAIQIARMLEAEIYTTVSSKDKISYLTEKLGIPLENIFYSRDTSFVKALMRRTDGKGVDVALNSLSGELLHATWRCIARWGKMIEIGKRDLIEVGKLDMDVFLANRSYCCVAIDQMREDKPEAASRLLKTIMEYYRQGFIRPIRLANVFPASKTPEAFKYMQQGSHIGKVIISLRDGITDKTDIESIGRSDKNPVTFDSAATYLLVGGLGGLGRTISIWMVQHGVRSITFLSRSSGTTPYIQDHVQLLESMGCAVQLICGSVTNAFDVKRAVEGAPNVLKGIIQMSMVLRDQSYQRMTLDDWTCATEPKVKGTWNLHEATLTHGVTLDFFLLFSSLSGVIGQPGQANYAAANSFLDAFVLYRNGLGLPCSAIDVGAIEGAGYLFENEDLLKKMRGTGWRSVREEELLEALGATIKGHKSSTGGHHSAIRVYKNNMLLGVSPTVSLSHPDCSQRLRQDVRMTVYHNMSNSDTLEVSGENNDTLKTLLAHAKRDVAFLKDPGTVAQLAHEIGRKLFGLLLKTEEELNINLGLSELGLDSMVAVEMRSWWKTNFGLEITVLDMMAMGTLEALGKRAAEELSALYD